MPQDNAALPSGFNPAKPLPRATLGTMQLAMLDFLVIGGVLLTILLIGMAAGRKGSGSADDFFLGGRNMPWWLLGTSMVATTFSADTPNLVTDLVRQQGVSGNWAWWAFLLTGMVTVFVYARLWRRSGVLTDIAFYELRYGGKAGAFLRGFRAVYLGLVFNVLVMATVSLAAIKLGSILLGWPGWMTLMVTCSVTLLFSVYGGLRAILWTDLFQFFLAMGGAVAASVYVLGLPEVGGIQGLMTHPNVMDKLSVWPDFSNPEVWVPVMLVPLAVQWWASYYPGADRRPKGHRWPLGQPALTARWCAPEPDPHFCLAGLQPPAAAGSGNRRTVHPALVLVADIGQHRNRGHGHVSARRSILHLGP